MRAPRAGRPGILGLAALALVLVGLQCPGSNPRKVRLVPSSDLVHSWEAFSVDVVATSTAPIQAWEFTLQFEPGRVFFAGIEPHPDFDDDGSLFVTPLWDPASGTVSPVVDLRHGPAATGTFVIARASFFALGTAGPTLISLSGGGLADPEGGDLPASLTPALVTIEP